MTTERIEDHTFRYAYECEKQERVQLELMLKIRTRELQIALQQLAEQHEALKKSASELRQVMQILKDTKDELRLEAQAELTQLVVAEQIVSGQVIEKTRKALTVHRVLTRFYQ